MLPNITYLFGIVIALCFLSCGNNLEDVKTVNATKETPDESMSGVKMVYTDNGIQRAVLKTPQISKFGTAQSRTEFPVGLTVDFFDPKGKRTAFVQSGFGTMNEQTRQLILEKNVRMINFDRNDTLETEYLVWKQDSALIVSDRQVHIHGPKGKVWGHHFRGRENFTKYKMKKVKVEYFYNQTDTL